MRIIATPLNRPWRFSP